MSYMNQPLDRFPFEHNGRAFTAHIYADDDSTAPWQREDGHGPVRELRGSTDYSNRPAKRPGERFLMWDRNWGLAYDWQAACKLARADGWNAEPYDAPHRIERAVQADFDRMRAYAEDRWSYVGVCVTPDDDEDADPYAHVLWGIESDSPDYLREVACELADECEPVRNFEPLP